MQNKLDQTLSNVLISNGVVVMPTDTIFGIVARLKSREAIDRIFELKHRDISKPIGTVLVESVDQVARMTTCDKEILRVARAYWPGPVSVVLPVDESYSYAHHGLGSLAFRVPDSVWLRALLAHTGPLATSSANISGEPVVESIVQARELFGDRIDYYEETHYPATNTPSTILRISDKGVEKLR